MVLNHETGHGENTNPIIELKSTNDKHLNTKKKVKGPHVDETVFRISTLDDIASKEQLTIDDEEGNVDLIKKKILGCEVNEQAKSSQYPHVHFCKSKKKWIAKLSLYGEYFQIGAYREEGDAHGDVEKVLLHWNSELREELDAMVKEERQRHWVNRVAPILGLPISEPSCKYFGVMKRGKGFAAKIKFNNHNVIFRTRSGPLGQEVAKRDYDAISPHKKVLEEKLKGIADWNEQRKLVQEFWAGEVGCDPPNHIKRVALTQRKKAKVRRRVSMIMPKDKAAKPDIMEE